LTSAEADCFRLEITQELQRITVESGPNCFAVFLAADNFLQSRISPYFPKVVVGVGLDVPESNPRSRGMLFPTACDYVLKFVEPATLWTSQYAP
jgi:hypothetical protein